MLGPTLIAHGTDEQKSRYLAPMLHGDEGLVPAVLRGPRRGPTWRASSREARQSDDGTFTLNGQEGVDRPNAQFASFGLLLARTDPDVPKHKGLTMFIVPMDRSGGVTVRGLRQITGEAEVQRGVLRRRRT